MNRSPILLTTLLFTATALVADPRINPPAIQETAPLALIRGMKTQIRVKGINLAGASQAVFDQPGIRAKVLHVNNLGEFVGRFIGSNNAPSTIDRGDPAPLHEAVIEVEVDPEAEIGLTRFRLATANGTTNAIPLSVEPYFGVRPEVEPNDSLAEALIAKDYIFPPAIVTGTLSKPGDIDHLPFRAEAGDEIVIHVTAAQIGSKVRWKLELFDWQGVAVTSKSVVEDRGESALAYRIPADGKYVVRVSDIEAGGGKGHFYRLRIGQYPYLTSTYPLGVGEGETAKVALRGYNLGAERSLTVTGKPDYKGMRRMDLRPEFDLGEAHNRLMLAVGEHPEVAEDESSFDPASAMKVTAPVTINGRISGFSQGEPRKADEDYFRFEARRGQLYVIEVDARRLGSPLDSIIEVLDASGRPVPKAAARASVKTKMVLSDRNSVQAGLRLEDLTHFEVGDYVMVGNEILRVEELPRGPDSDYFFDSFGGQRIGYFDTTPEAHAVETPVYKVSMHSPDAEFPPNGLPVRRFDHRNDDGGPGFDKDSRLHFTAPADGEYIVSLRDLKGLQGEDFAYRLTIREAQPDFRLSLSPENPNIPRGGSVAVTVSALRLDQFDGPIDVEARGLPNGVTATKGTIAPGETSTTLVLSAPEDARFDGAAQFEVAGTARIGGEEQVRMADPDNGMRLLALAEPGDIHIEFEAQEIALEAGGTAQIAVRIERRNGFAGRVPVTALNLPYGVKVTDIGLNGILIRPEQTRRVFTVAALPWVEPGERLITVNGQVETRSPVTRFYAAKPVKLRIQPGKVSAAPTQPVASSGAAR